MTRSSLDSGSLLVIPLDGLNASKIHEPRFFSGATPGESIFQRLFIEFLLSLLSILELGL